MSVLTYIYNIYIYTLFEVIKILLKECHIYIYMSVLTHIYVCTDIYIYIYTF